MEEGIHGTLGDKDHLIPQVDENVLVGDGFGAVEILVGVYLRPQRTRGEHAAEAEQQPYRPGGAPLREEEKDQGSEGDAGCGEKIRRFGVKSNSPATLSAALRMKRSEKTKGSEQKRSL